MDTLTIFGLQFVLSLVVYALFAKWYVSPWLAGKSLHVALIILVFPHAMRHVGLSFVVPALLVTHAMVFARLYKHATQKSQYLAGSPTAISNPGR
jgi:hypothetical protein